MNKQEDPYIEKAADILAELVRKNWKEATPVEEEVKNFKKNLAQTDNLDKLFKENSEKLIDWFKNRKNKP